MEEQKICRQLRKEFGKTGWALLVYSLIMNLSVTGVCIVDALIRLPLSNAELDYFTLLTDSVMNNAWGYALACGIGLAAMFFWKGKEFCFKDIWKTENGMKLKDFLCLLCVFISGQAVFQILAGVFEWIFNQFGMSILESMESATMTADSFSMFLYLTLLAPVTEEIFFRGLILRSLEPYGKKFAILSSAFLFGIFHGNIIQSPYAFVVGLVLGYVTVEYSIGWAMVLHMLNNLVLGDMMTRITQFIPPWAGELLSIGIIWGFTIGAIIVLAVNREKIADYFRKGRMHPWCVKSFFGSTGVIVLTVYMALNMLMTLVIQQFA